MQPRLRPSDYILHACSLDGLALGLTLLLELPCESLLLASGVLLTAGGSLLLELLLTLNLSLLLVDGLDKDILVLVLVTLGGGVHAMVHSSVDLARVTIPAEESTEDTGAAHPEEHGWHTGVGSTLSATVAKMATLLLGEMPRLRSGTGVGVDLTAHDKTVLGQLADVLAYNSPEL